MLKFILFLLLIPSISWATGYELSLPNQNTGIGTASPKDTLGVGGNLSVGSSTYTNSIAPTNGAIIQGNIGIGSLTPGQKLDVQGTVRALFFSGDGSALTGISGSQTPWISAINGAGYSLANTGNIGIGTPTANNSLQINGGGIGAETVNKGYELIVSTPGTLSSSNTEVTDLLVHKGKLYIGYYDNGSSGTKSAQIYSWDGNISALVHSFGTGNHFQNVSSLAEYQGNLYAGIQGLSAGDGDVYVSTDDGATWSLSLNEATAQFAYSMTVFKGKLYEGKGFGASKIDVFDGTTWTNAYAGMGLSSANLVNNLYVYKGMLFAAIGNGGLHGGVVSSPDGGNFSTELNLMTVTRFIEFKGKLYATTQSQTDPNPLYVRNDSTSTWSQVLTFAGTSQCWGLATYNNALYVGCTVTGGAVIYKSYDGVNFSTDFTNNYQGAKGTEAFRMINYDASLYIGMGFNTATTAEIWRKTDSLGQQEDWKSTFINKFRQNTYNGYNWPNDSSLVSVTSPWSFDSNVGISTGNPGQNLDIQGTARMTGFILSTNPSSSYILTSNSVGVGTWMPSSGGAGTVTSVTLATPNSTLSLGGTNPVTTSGTINVDLNLTNSNTWTGKQIFNTANVGISSTNPGQKLDVQGTVRALFFSGDGSALTGISGSISGLTINKIPKATASTTIADSNISEVSGNVGIGSLTPGQVLDVVGTVRATQFISGTGSASLTGDANGNIGINSTAPGQVLDVNGTVRAINFSGAGTNLTGTAASLSIGGNAATVTTNANLTGAVTSTGNSTSNNFTANIGIGSATPGQALDINGTVRMIGFNIVSGAGSGKVLQSDASGNGAWAANSGTNYWTTGTGGNIGIATSNTVGIGTTLGNAALTVMNGNVGIGTWNPSNPGLIIIGGNIGIGTAIPNIALGVGSTNQFSASSTGVIAGSSETLTNGGASTTGLTITSNSLTSGSGLNINSSSTGITNFLGVINSSSASNKAPVLKVIQAGTVGAALWVSSGNIGIGTANPVASLGLVGNIGIGTNSNGDNYLTTAPPNGGMIIEGNVGIGSTAPQASLDLGTTGTLVSHRTTGLGWSEHNAANQACNTTCGASACVIGLDAGTVGVLNSNFVACTDATADDCICAGP